MAKEEITTSLMNALERGESMDKAMQTLLSAGYTMPEIQEAARELNVGAIQRVEAIRPSPPYALGQLQQPIQGYKPLPSALSEEEAKKSTKMAVILLIILVLLIIVAILSWIYLF